MMLKEPGEETSEDNELHFMRSCLFWDVFEQLSSLRCVCAVIGGVGDGND